MDQAEALMKSGQERLEAWVQGLPPTLSRAFREVWDPWLGACGPRGPGALFLGPMGTPAFPLLAWVAQATGQGEGEDLDRAAEAMFTLYVAVRCQDDIVDEGRPPERVYLVQALLARGAALLHPGVDVEGILVDFSVAALEDLALRRDPAASWDPAALLDQGRKYLPMLLPLLSLLHGANQGHEGPALRACVERLSASFQLTNDLVAADLDLAAGLRSPFHAAMGLRPGVHEAGDVEPAIRRDPQAFGRYCDTVEALARQGLDLAPFHRPTLAALVEDRLQGLRAFSDTLLLKSVLFARPVALDLEVTTRCNLRCGSCFVHQALGEAHVDMPTSLALAILKELSGFNGTVHLTGGEPFLHPDLWRLLEAARDLSLHDVLINTNASLLGQAALERLGALGIRPRLLVSLDGPGDLHLRTRGQASWDGAMEILAHGPRWGVGTEVATLLTRELVEAGIQTFYEDICARVGRRPPLTLWALFHGPGLRLQDRTPSAGAPPTLRDLEEAARQVAAMLRGGDTVVVGDQPVINPLLTRLGVDDSHLSTCEGGRSRLCVQADGTVTPCHPLRLPLERLTEERVPGFILRAFRHPHARRMGARGWAPCERCPDREPCGGCRAVSAGLGLQPWESAQPCSRFRDTVPPVPTGGDSP